MYQSADAKKERIPTAGFLQRRYPLYEVLLCLIVGVLPSLRRPALLLSSVLGQKIELTAQNPRFYGLSAFSSKITQSSFTATQLIFPASTSASRRWKAGRSKVCPEIPLSV